MHSARYSVGIIGAGRIVAGFDKPGDAMVLTHAHALHEHARFGVTGIFDADAATARAAADKWSLPVASSIDSLLGARNDVVLIAVPDAFHLRYLETLLEARPKLVLCEKPLTGSLAESERIVARYADAGIALGVCYQRRYDADVNAMRDAYRSGALGALLTGTVYYSKGVLHNGSHAVDLLRYVLGEITSSVAYGKRDDFTPQDPSVAARISFADGDVTLAIADERLYSLFEIDLVFERGRYRFTDGGLQVEISRVIPDPTWAGYTILAVEETRPSSLPVAMRRLWDAVARSLDTDTPLASSGHEAARTQAACEHLLHQVRP